MHARRTVSLTAGSDQWQRGSISLSNEGRYRMRQPLILLLCTVASCVPGPQTLVSGIHHAQDCRPVHSLPSRRAESQWPDVPSIRGKLGGVVMRVRDHGSGDPLAATWTMTFGDSSTTRSFDSSGVVVLDSLRPGSYGVSVRMIGFERAEGSVSIRTGSWTRVDVRLQQIRCSTRSEQKWPRYFGQHAL
jgi:hypothetical protein